MWASHSESPLQADELCHALAVERGYRDLNAQSVPSIKTLLGCCLGLVSVEAPSSTVRLVRFTLQEYLTQTPGLFHTPHAMIAEVCLTYLSFRSIMKLEFLPYTRSPAPILSYASRHWVTHARWGFNENVKPLVCSLLGVYDRNISDRLFLWNIMSNLSPESWRPGFTGLHCAAYHGFSEIMVDLLDKKQWNPNVVDLEGNTAIM